MYIKNMHQLVLFVLVLTLYTVNGNLNIEKLKYCCNLGTNYANSSAECKNFQTPITDIEQQDEIRCLQSIEVCCRNHNKELQCQSGIEDAKNDVNCSTISGIRKDCCDACQMGRDTGAAQHPCPDGIGLGPPFDKTFADCCQDAPTATQRTTTAARAFQRPSFDNVCDIGDVCAQICIPTADSSYRCACNKGYVLMADGISCRLEKRAQKKGDRCSANNPCDHDCTDTGVAVKCSCRDGYELQKDKRTCKDVDECATNSHDCEPGEVCVNEDGTYYCEDPNYTEVDEFDTNCPSGYKFDGEKKLCNDIDECEFDIICPRPKLCINTIGSFRCEGEDIPQCPPGFHYKSSTDSCADIDECLSGANDCNKESQVCLNTKGNYTCIDKVSKKTCPPGFKKNPYTQNCDDVNECLENEETCKADEMCVNEPGGHSCVAGNSKSTPTTTSTTIQSTTTTKKSTKTVSCPSGFKFSTKYKRCDDINECEEENICDSTQNCYNSVGSYVCSCKTGFTKDHHTAACVDINECQVGAHDCTVAQRCDNTIGSYLCARITGCGTGYTLNYANGLCEDDDECVLGTHNCNDLGSNFRCRNTLGSYRCDPIRAVPKLTTMASTTTSTFTTVRHQLFTTSATTPRQTSMATPRPTSVTTPRQTSMTTPRQVPVTIPGAGVLRRCLPGFRMNERGACEDINECESNPCRRGQTCFNFNGNYQCINTVQCSIGYEMDDAGERCVDVNECTRGTHRCNPTQICKNGQGYYTCECPPGHHLNKITRLCEDIDECKYYRACSSNADCINTAGSYTCRCKAGFRENGNTCDDIDECRTAGQLCEHNCVNLWGSFRCACKPGFVLNADNRTCTDMDECQMFKDKRLCIGTCENVPGSYRCRCPRGYTLGTDGRTCKDVDECQENVCRPADNCLNTRGSYKCYSINCPSNYFRDPEHKGRCKRPQTLCDPRDVQCIMLPEQYTYHYIALVSDLPVADGHIQFFQIKGPQWTMARAEFTMKIVNVQYPHGVQAADASCFKKVNMGFNTMQLYLVKPIKGPQEIELKVEMHLYHGNTMSANVVSHIFILVSEYPF